MDEEERKRIETDARWEKDIETRMASAERVINRILLGLGSAAALMLTTIWDQLKAVLFK